MNPKYVLNIWAISVEFFQKKTQHSIFVWFTRKKHLEPYPIPIQHLAGQARHFGPLVSPTSPVGNTTLTCIDMATWRRPEKGKAWQSHSLVYTKRILMFIFLYIIIHIFKYIYICVCVSCDIMWLYMYICSCSISVPCLPIFWRILRGGLYLFCSPRCSRFAHCCSSYNLATVAV